MPNIDLSILNQRQTPAFYADTLANRPSAGFIGRIFVSTNTFEFYRDNGTTWDLIGGPGTSTVTGTGANGQVTYWNGTSSITGSNNLFFDAVNGHLGVGTITPGTALDVKHDQSTVVQLEQETATNDTRIAFINSGVGLWRLGAFYNAGANDFGLFDIAAAAQPVTVKRTTGQVLIGTTSVGTGKLVVVSATSDNGIQIVGATAPSLRIDNAEIAPTKRIGLGIATNTNNFIQGSADRDFCIFNGSTAAASPILFGIYDAAAVNVQEAARISAARNFLIGTTTDAGFKLAVNGTTQLSGKTNVVKSISDYAFTLVNTDASGYGMYIQAGGTNNAIDIFNAAGSTNLFSLTGIGAATFSNSLGINGVAASYPLYVRTGTNQRARFVNNGGIFQFGILNDAESAYADLSIGNSALIVKASNNVLIGTTTDAGQKLQVNGNAAITGQLSAINSVSTDFIATFQNTNSNSYGVIIKSSATASSGYPLLAVTDSTGATTYFRVDSGTGNVGIKTSPGTGSPLKISGLPTSAVGLSSGDVYSNLGVLTIV
jgi:hypothetical protein